MELGDNDPPRRLPPDSGDENKLECPYLGLRDDPHLRYSYPEALNCCHRVSRPQHVAMDHQRAVCLAGAYQACPVYSTDWKGPLPKEYRGIEHRAKRSLGMSLVIGGLVLLLAGVFIYSQWPAGPARPAGNATSGPASLVELTRSTTPVPLFSTTPTITFTPTLPSPTRSPTLQITPTIINPTSTIFNSSTPGPLEKTPFGPNGRYLVHVVKDGEFMEAIAKLYATSPVVLKAINGLKPDAGFWPGTPVVVAVGEADPNNVFAMQAVWIAQPIRLDVLAQKYATSADELRTFNGLGPGDTVPSGRWIIARKK
jgi:LysM repeat protein